MARQQYNTMTLFKTPYNFDSSDEVNYEVISNEPSMTVPDQSLTVKEILERYTQGIPMDISMQDNDLEYDGDDPSFDDVNPFLDPAFDLSDLTDMELERVRLLAEQEQAQRTQEAAAPVGNEKDMTTENSEATKE